MKITKHQREILDRMMDGAVLKRTYGVGNFMKGYIWLEQKTGPPKTVRYDTLQIMIAAKLITAEPCGVGEHSLTYTLTEKGRNI